VKRIGVLAIQGDVSEHERAVAAASRASGIPAVAVAVRRAADFHAVHALILPGGESTTLSKMLHRNGLFAPVKARAEQGSLAILGTCAGMIVIAKGGDAQVAKTHTDLLGLIDLDVDRNAFGRQRDSFEVDLEVDGFSSPLHAVFIRAPAIRRAFGRAKLLARVGELGVFASQGNFLATAFHPELTADTRVHEMLIHLA
jgi:5'-phosphate synthase pdxT subunit